MTPTKAGRASYQHEVAHVLFRVGPHPHALPSLTLRILLSTIIFRNVGRTEFRSTRGRRGRFP
jgi:hypothetical protein